MLQSAFNALTKLHSRPALLKRLGTVATFSPIRVTPSNYFRFLRGPEHTTIPGKEFIITLESIRGHFAQSISFSALPTSGEFKLKYGANKTGVLQYDTTAATIQTELKLLPGLSSVTVSGNFSVGFIVTFLGSQTAPELGQVVESTLDSTASFANTYTPWEDSIKRGDRILEGSKLYTVDEIIEMPDLGGKTMGFRCRCD